MFFVAPRRLLIPWVICCGAKGDIWWCVPIRGRVVSRFSWCDRCPWSSCGIQCWGRWRFRAWIVSPWRSGSRRGRLFWMVVCTRRAGCFNKRKSISKSRSVKQKALFTFSWFRPVGEWALRSLIWHSLWCGRCCRCCCCFGFLLCFFLGLFSLHFTPLSCMAYSSNRNIIQTRVRQCMFFIFSYFFDTYLHLYVLPLFLVRHQLHLGRIEDHRQTNPQIVLEELTV